jgi:hypothetical protein
VGREAHYVKIMFGRSIKMDIKNCVDAFERHVSKEVARLEADKKAAEAQCEAKTLVVFQEFGLEPKRVCGRSAFFDYDGNEIELVYVEWRYGANAFYRVLGKCKECEGLLATDEYDLTQENIGSVIRNPQARYHDCPNWNATSTKLPVEHKSVRERLMDILDEYLRTAISASQEGA